MAKGNDKRFGQFFLYLPAKSGYKWLDRVKKAAKRDEQSPSRLIRDAVRHYLRLTSMVRGIAQEEGVDPVVILKRAVREYIAPTD